MGARHPAKAKEPEVEEEEEEAINKELVKVPSLKHMFDIFSLLKSKPIDEDFLLSTDSEISLERKKKKRHKAWVSKLEQKKKKVVKKIKRVKDEFGGSFDVTFEEEQSVEEEPTEEEEESEEEEEEEEVEEEEEGRDMKGGGFEGRRHMLKQGDKKKREKKPKVPGEKKKKKKKKKKQVLDYEFTCKEDKHEKTCKKTNVCTCNEELELSFMCKNDPNYKSAHMAELERAIQHRKVESNASLVDYSGVPNETIEDYCARVRNEACNCESSSETENYCAQKAADRLCKSSNDYRTTSSSSDDYCRRKKKTCPCRRRFFECSDLTCTSINSEDYYINGCYLTDCNPISDTSYDATSCNDDLNMSPPFCPKHRYSCYCMEDMKKRQSGDNNRSSTSTTTDSFCPRAICERALQSQLCPSCPCEDSTEESFICPTVCDRVYSCTSPYSTYSEDGCTISYSIGDCWDNPCGFQCCCCREWIAAEAAFKRYTCQYRCPICNAKDTGCNCPQKHLYACDCKNVHLICSKCQFRLDKCQNFTDLTSCVV